jgi:integrating conjugative element membrane protein (TIGR03747 family)
MASTKDEKRNRQAEKGRSTLFSILIDVLLYIPIALFMSALISTLIEWLGMFFDWWAIEGIKHSQNMLINELSYLNARLDKNIFEPMTGITIKEVFDFTVGRVSEFFKWLGLWSYATSVNGAGFGDYIGAAVNMIILTCIRFMVFIFGLPTYILFGWIGLVVGMVEREKRKAGGGRESGVIFELSKKCVSPSLAVAMFLYLAWPNSINPVFIIFPFACIFGLSIAYMSASYKKYI